MPPTWMFRELVRSPTEDWTQDCLNQLPARELAELCALVGIRYSGTKPEQVERLVVQTAVQRCVRGYGLKQGEQPTVAQIQAFANAYKGKELKVMCRTAGCYAGSTKYAMAASLIGWRFGCLRRGQEYYRHAKEAVKSRPTRQLMLKERIIIGGEQMEGSIFPALLMSAIAFLIQGAQIALFRALLKTGTKTQLSSIK